MAKDDIIRMALEAGFDEHRGNHPVGWGEYPISNEVIEKFAALVAAAERKACIKLLSKDMHIYPESLKSKAAVAHCISAILTRENSEIS
jgi:hypothetical protein